MNDTASKIDNFDELKFSSQQGFFDKSLGVKALIGILFTLCLFAILHFREVKVESLELNSTAGSYIVAQTDFEFLDEEATYVLKHDAVLDIGKIYRISEKEIRERRSELEATIAKDEKWKIQKEDQKEKPLTTEGVYQALDQLEKVLLSLHFTDPRTLQKMKEQNVPANTYMLFTPLKTDEEVLFPRQIWNQISQLTNRALPKKDKTVQFAIDYFQSKPLEIVEDIPTKRSVIRLIQAKVPNFYSKVTAGNRIINQGDKVTARSIAMLQAMKKALNEKRNLFNLSTLIGSLILSLLLTGVCAAYIFVNYPEIMISNRKLFLIVTVLIITFGIAKVTEFFFLSSQNNLIEVIRYPLFVPFSAILLCSLLNPAIATFTSAFLSIILMMTLAFDRQGFMIMNLTAALVAILSGRNLRQRKEIFVVCLKAWIACIVVIISLHLYQNTGWVGFFTDVTSAGGFMLLTAVLVVGSLPLLETGFRVMTDVTLMEYMDPNHDLLRRLSVEAPGTYQHSVVVGNLSEAAALAIQANGLFCRVVTLYHDIGKMATPQYFTENQHGGMNIHQLLTPKESAQVIIAHVQLGVEMARKANLPEQFIDIIKEHHGTTLVYYFYRKELENVGGDKAQVDLNHFRYSGPTPRSKESLIIMLADSLEAASRSLEKINEESITDLLSRIIKEKAEDGQFDHSLLTLEELSIVKETLVKTLVAYGHARVKYPKRDRGEETLRE